MECNCKGWQKSADQIFSVQVLVALTKGMLYTGDQFKFCPWCGKDLASQSVIAEFCGCLSCGCPSKGVHYDECTELGRTAA